MNIHMIFAWAPGLPEILVILVVVLLLFGGKKIPELMKGVGKGIKEFKNGINEGEENKEEKDPKK